MASCMLDRIGDSSGAVLLLASPWEVYHLDPRSKKPQSESSRGRSTWWHTQLVLRAVCRAHDCLALQES